MSKRIEERNTNYTVGKCCHCCIGISAVYNIYSKGPNTLACGLLNDLFSLDKIIEIYIHTFSGIHIKNKITKLFANSSKCISINQKYGINLRWHSTSI